MDHFNYPYVKTVEGGQLNYQNVKCNCFYASFLVEPGRFFRIFLMIVSGCFGACSKNILINFCTALKLLSAWEKQRWILLTCTCIWWLIEALLSSGQISQGSPFHQVQLMQFMLVLPCIAGHLLLMQWVHSLLNPQLVRWFPDDLQWPSFTSSVLSFSLIGMLSS